MADLTPTLVQRALAGEREAVRVLVDTLTPLVQSRVARTLLRHRRHGAERDVRQEVSDFTQAVFEALFEDRGRALRSWDPDRGLGLPAFVGMLADREIASILRSRRRNPYTEEPVSEDLLGANADTRMGPELEAISRDTLKAVLDRLEAELPDRGWEMFNLLFLDERSVEDVAEILEMSPDAIYAWKSRLGRRVRRIVAELSSESCSDPRRLP